ncbi:MAG: hypothetical protein EYR95_12875 [Phormidium sp. SL48-SHIP]|nr:MAG: hypothetical protein EYR95_12875 [Phormidium sp. SL48-SHIP]
MAQDINQFLNNSEESQLVVQTPQAWASLAIPLGLILMAPLIAIEFRKTISCTFDKTSDRLTILRKGVADEQTLDYPLQAITEVTVESRDTGDDHEEHRLVVQIDDEKTVPITEYGHMLGFSHQEAIAQRIEAFLGLSD